MAVTPTGHTPVPDPTQLTTEQLIREIGALREATTNERHALERLVDEKFRSVDQQLDLVERQRVEQKSDTKAAVDAALTAQKEAVKEQTTASATAIGKSESGMKEQLTQLRENFDTSIRSLQDVLGDLKDRIVKLESFRVGNSENRTDLRSTVAVMLSVGFFLISVISVIALFAL
jgi:ABC-type transporter MlaC component